MRHRAGSVVIASILIGAGTTAARRAPQTSGAQTVTPAMAQAAPIQDLAASFLGNRSRLEILARYAKGEFGNANVFLGSEQVTSSNVKQLTDRYQQRQDVYGAELKRRGASKLDGRFTLGEEPCPNPSPDSIDVDLTQNGFEIELKKAGPAADHLFSGVAAGGILVIGDGDFDPDMYAFGKIEPTRVVLRPFSSRSTCGFMLTRK